MLKFINSNFHAINHLFNNSIGQCTTGSIRIVNGPSEREGMLETCFLDHWGTTCNNFNLFTEGSARVACRQLGYTMDG